jgi:hypothetical protein
LGVLGFSEAEHVVAWMVARNMVDLKTFEEALLWSRGAPGAAQVQLLASRIRAHAASGLELDFSDLLHLHGIEGWEGNVPVRTASGRRVSADAYFRAERLAIFIDGRRYHSDRQTFEHDRSVQNGLVLAGELVLRFTYARIHEDPQGVIAEILAALETRARQSVIYCP